MIAAMFRTGTKDLDVVSTMQDLRWVIVDVNISRMMEKSETSATGNAKDLCLRYLNQIVPRILGMEDVHVQTMVQEVILSERDEILPPHGVRDVVRKRAQDHHDVNFKSVQSPRELLLQLSRTTSGVQRCDLIHQ